MTRLFRETLKSDKPVIIHRGGARSSKSYSILQYLIYRMTNEPNCQILITRKTMPALRLTTYKDFIDLLKLYGLYDYCDHSQTYNTVTYKPNNSFIAFISLQDPERIKSSEWNIIFMEEVNEFNYNDYMILNLRLSAPTDFPGGNKLIMALNPVDAFSWVKTELLDKDPNIQEIISNYLDNPTLSKEYIERLLHTKDPYYRKVYINGEWGVLENLIFNHWKEIDILPPAEKTIYGCDFGYTDPTSIVECRFTDSGVYVKELLYRMEMTNQQLISWCKDNINTSVVMYCDSAEPDRIVELKRAGINARPASKGQDSVRKSIDTVKSQELYISSDSVNLIKEIRSYKWAEGKDGKPTNKPAEGFDHLVDAMRYAIHTYLLKYRTYTLITGSSNNG